MDLREQIPDGQSETRLAFEAELVGVLLESDYNGARDRIAALPEDQRREALESISFSDLESGAQQGYASLVRELVPQDEQAGSLSYIMFDLTLEGGYERVDAFLDSIKATPEEREVSAREAANSRLQDISTERALTAADVDEMRTWLGRQAPESIDEVTGEAIGDAAQEGGEEFNFAAASELVLKYHQSTGNDAILVAFLESYAAHSNLEEALPLAKKFPTRSFGRRFWRNFDSGFLEKHEPHDHHHHRHFGRGCGSGFLSEPAAELDAC